MNFFLLVIAPENLFGSYRSFKKASAGACNLHLAILCNQRRSFKRGTSYIYEKEWENLQNVGKGEKRGSMNIFKDTFLRQMKWQFISCGQEMTENDYQSWKVAN